MEEVSEGTPGINRRDFVKRSAIIGGLVWAAPVVNSFAAPAFAGTHEVGNLCPPGGGQPRDLVWRYHHVGCEATDNNQVGDTCWSDPTHPNGVSGLKIVVQGGPDSGTYEVDVTLVNNSFDFGAPPDGGRAGAEQTLTVYRNGTKVHEVSLHTSCSQPLAIGDRFGAFELIGGFPN